MMRSITQVLFAGLLIVWLSGLGSCANMIPPSGGPKDSLPPRLMAASPKDSAVNVNTHKVTLVFDEFVSLDNAFANLIVSPSLKNQPNITSKLNTVTITIKDTMDPNTTYAFNFGNSVVDVNERNVAKDLTYVISTGPTIDTNSYYGKVLMAETGKVDSADITAVLYQDLSDSAVYKKAPRYYTRLNGRGEFEFHFLPAGSFNVYAIDKKSYNRTYTDSSFLFAFRSAPVVVGAAGTKPDTLYAYQAYKKTESYGGGTTVKQLPVKEDKRLRYSVELDNGQQDVLGSMQLAFARRLTTFDSTKIGLYDTSFHLLTGYSVSLDSSKSRITVKYPWKYASPYRLLIAKDAVADSAGTTLSKADTLRFYTKKETDYGSVRLRFTNLDLSKHPILQFVQGDKMVDSFPLTQPDFYRKVYHPGNYDMRILYDANNNGKWDPGQFLPNKRQPEVIVLISRQLNVRGNWDNEITVVL
jgi:hypothetical protein